MSEVAQILLKDGPVLSSELAKKLEAKGMSAQTARQRIVRAGEDVVRLPGIVFPHRARFLYHQKDWGSERFWAALIRDISTASPAYGAALAALQARGGIVPRHHFSIVSGSPIRQKGQISSDTVLARLEAVRLVRSADVEGIGPVVVLNAGGQIGAFEDHHLRSRLIVENILLLAVRDWAKRLGMASYEKIAVRGDGPLPQFGTFNWDLCGPSYLAPIVRRDQNGKPKPGFLVCDVVSGVMDENAVGAFVRKFKLVSAPKNMSPFLPVLIADGFTREAFRLGRSHGLMLATPKNLFGKDVAVGLATLLETLGRAAAVAVKRPEVMGELFDKLGAIEGASINLRGALFELMVAHVTQALGGGSIDVGATVANKTFHAEVDVRRVLAADVYLYECRGYQPDHLIDLDAIEHWLTDRVPGVYGAMRQEQRFQGMNFHFEFWTSGGFTPEALGRLEKARAQTKRYSISCKAAAEVRAEVAKLTRSGVAEMLDQHFFQHPVARFSRKYDAPKAYEELGIDVQLGGYDGIEDLEADFDQLLVSPPALPHPTSKPS